MPDLLALDLPFTIQDEITCVTREIVMRESVYPRRIAAGNMTQAKADHELGAMRAVLARLQRIKDEEQRAPHDRSSRL